MKYQQTFRTIIALVASTLVACGGGGTGPSGDGGGGGGGGQQQNAALADLTINPSTVTAGTAATGTVSLTLAAPASGAVVTLSSNSDKAVVPNSVAIASGSTSNTFNISTPAGATAGTAILTATYLGVNKTANLAVNAVPLRADFRVIPNAGTPVTGEQCAVYRDEAAGGGLLNQLRCKFDASASTPSTGITDYQWTFPTNNTTVQFTGAVLDTPTVACNTFASAANRDITLRITTATGTNTITRTITFVKVNPC